MGGSTGEGNRELRSVSLPVAVPEQETAQGLVGAADRESALAAVQTTETGSIDPLLPPQYKFYRPPQEPELGPDSILTGPKV